MNYIIYPDTLFLENLVCNLVFLAFMKSMFFPAATWKRILFAGMMTAFCNTLASILFFRCIWILQLGVLLPAAGVMVCYCLQLRDAKRILYLLYQMILWTLVLGGILQALEQWMALRDQVTEVPQKVGSCIRLEPEEAMMLHRILYRLLDQE